MVFPVLKWPWHSVQAFMDSRKQKGTGRFSFLFFLVFNVSYCHENISPPLTLFSLDFTLLLCLLFHVRQTWNLGLDACRASQAALHSPPRHMSFTTAACLLLLFLCLCCLPGLRCLLTSTLNA